MADSVLRFILTGADMGASAALAKVGLAAKEAGAETVAASDKAAAAHDRHAAALKKVGQASAVALIAIGVESVKMAGNFQQATSILVTAAGEQTKNIDNVRHGILNLMGSTGASMKDLTDGAYILEKAGYRNNDMLHILKAGAQAAAEEGANLTTVVGASSAVMHDYHLPVSAAVTVTNQLKAAAGEAKATFEEFDAALGVVVPRAATAGISFADLSGVLANMTQHGISAQESAQQIDNSIRNLAAPNQVAQKMMAQLGIQVNDVTTRLGDGPGGRGLAGTLNYLSTTVLQHMGPSGLVLLSTLNSSKMAADDARVMFGKLSPAAQDIAKQYDAGTLSVKEATKAMRGLTDGPMGNLGLQYLSTDKAAHGFQTTLKNGVNNSKTYIDMMKTLTGGANGLNVALNTTGANAPAVAESIKRVGDAGKNSGVNVQGWEQQQKNLNQRFHEFRGAMDVVMIEIGQKLLPVVSGLFKFLSDHHGVLLGLVFTIGTLLVTATLAWVASLTAAAVEMTIAMAPVLLIGGAIFALGVIVKTCWERFQTFRTIVSTALAILVTAISDFAIYSIKMMQWFGDGFIFVVHNMINATKFFAEISDAVFHTHLAKAVQDASNDVDQFKKSFDGNMSAAATSVGQFRDSAVSHLQAMARGAKDSSGQAGQAVVDMGQRMLDTMTKLDGKHAQMSITANGSVSFGGAVVPPSVVTGSFGASQLAAAGHATGGYISGPGGPRDDAIPARLSNGEFVVNAAATSRHLPMLHAINAKGYADGGLVGVGFQDNASANVTSGIDSMLSRMLGMVSSTATKVIDKLAAAPMQMAYAFAQSKTGMPYSWGGGHGVGSPGHPYGGPFDCSGFVSQVLDAAGIANPNGIVTSFYNWMAPGRSGKFDIGIMNPNGSPSQQHMGIGIGGHWFETGGLVGGTGPTADYFPIVGHVPGFANGGVAQGLVRVGESGPELVHVGQPSRVYSNSDSQAMMGGVTVQINGPVYGGPAGRRQLAQEIRHELLTIKRGGQNLGLA